LFRLPRFENEIIERLFVSKQIVIIGGGVIGLSAAWYCQQRGHQVTVIDRQGAQRNGCSFGNAGMIVPSHIVPLAAPGMIRLGLKWIWNPRSPFYIRPRASWELLAWLWQFKQSCTPQHVDRAAPLLRDLHLASRECFDQLQSEIPGGFGLVQEGLLMLCRTAAGLKEETEMSERARDLGLAVEVLDAEGTAALDPAIEMDIRGAVYYPQDCFLSPNQLMAGLQTRLENQGCRFLWNTDLEDLVVEGETLKYVSTTAGDLAADEFLLCAGAWTSEIARQHGISLPMQAGKGYSLTLDQPRQQPNIGSILTEARIAVTPIQSTLRFGGTMEIAGLDESISQSRIEGIVQAVPKYFPAFRVEDFTQCKPWVGLRPCSPDGLPYLGRPSRWRNVVISTGHAMMGISLAMISGRITADIIDGIEPKIQNLEMLSPDRYGG
jgi:D-amino-acid dehydrogenase